MTLGMLEHVARTGHAARGSARPPRVPSRPLLVPDQDACDSPDQVALRGWAGSPAADPRVTQVTVAGNRAEVIIEVADGYPDYVYCVLTDGGWVETTSGNGPTVGWQDPSLYGWGDPT